MKGALAAAAAAVAALALGIAMGRASAPVEQPAPVPEPPRHDLRDREIARLRDRVSELERRVSESAPPPVPATARSDAPTSAGDVLRRLAGSDVPPARVADAEALAMRLRVDAEAAAASADRRAGEQVAAEIARERAAMRDAQRGGTMALLRRLNTDKVRALDLAASPEDFGPLFERRTTGPVVDGPAWRKSAGLVEGSVLRFPAGFHALGDFDFQHEKSFPADVVIEGAGMDATIVRMGEIDASVEIRSLTFRDLTLDNDGNLTDLRSTEPATIRLERCRVIGFDDGAGGSNMLDARVAAFYATDSRFETGFGHSPGTGNLIDARGGTIVARFERCTIAGPMYSPGFRISDGTAIVFDSCRFVDMGAAFAKTLETPPGGVRFVNCTTESRDPGDALTARRQFLDSVAARGDASMTAAVRSTYRRVFEDRK